MMDSNVICKIEQFIEEIKWKYPKLNIGYEYDQEDDTYKIWHTDEYLEFNDTSFAETAGAAISKYLYDNNLFNVYFTYDYDKSQKSLSNTYYAVL